MRDPASSFNFESLQSTRMTCTQTKNLISNFVPYLNINWKLRKVSNKKDTAQDKKGSQDNEEGRENLEGIYTFLKMFSQDTDKTRNNLKSKLQKVRLNPSPKWLYPKN